MRRPNSIAILTFALSAAACAQTKTDKMTQELLNRLDSEEKVHLVLGTGMEGFSGETAVIGSTKSIVPGAAGTSYPLDEKGIPPIVLADGPLGLRIDPRREGTPKTFYCTAFPSGTLLASTWDREMGEMVGEAMGKEAFDYGIDVMLCPAMNIHRHPLNGRNFEYYSEDPLLSGKMGAAFVGALQKEGVGASVKHFAANNQETNRTSNNVIVSERALREIYLKGFEIAVKEGKPWCMMSSYNKINGQYTSQNRELLTTLLRDEWGFDGVVMTDWFGGDDPVAQIHAGNDMIQPGAEGQFETLMRSLGDGKLDEKDLDLSAGRIIDLIRKTPTWNKVARSGNPDLGRAADVARRSAVEGMILLKNEGSTLPIDDKGSKVALFGITSYDLLAGGTGSSDVVSPYKVSLFDGLNECGYASDPSLSEFYLKYLEEGYEDIARRKAQADILTAYLMPGRPEEAPLSDMEIETASSENDLAIMTLGRQSGEFRDRPSSDFCLSTDERDLLEKICRHFHEKGKKVVVILNICGVMETASWKDLPDAILLCWMPGQEGGRALADILSGTSSPCGKLPVTFPLSLEDVSSSENFPIDQSAEISVTEKRQDQGVANIDFTKYDEGIYIGYRWFDKNHLEVSYPFGFGLSYTTFNYLSPSVKKTGDKITVEVDVVNTGNAPGREIVQLYSSSPAGELDFPQKELRGFVKTATLCPGERERVRIDLSLRDLASFDEKGHCWVICPGKHRLLLGSSSRDIRESLSLDLPPYREKVMASF